MMKRLSAGVLLVAIVVIATAMTASAERPTGKEWTGHGIRNPMINHDLPLFFRSSAGTTWVRVHPAGTSPCSPADTVDSSDGQTIEHVWCFEGAGGDSSWPAAGLPDAQGEGTWDHWSKFAPPVAPASKWHVTNLFQNPAGGTWNAWAGCDSIIGNNNDAACQDIAFWVFKVGYGDDWNYSLQLDVPSANTLAGGTLEFDLRYDSECLYDYLYLEYLNNTSGFWEAVTDTAGNDAVFNGVSGTMAGGGNRECGDIFNASDQIGGQPAYGSSTWLADVTFPLPQQAGGLFLRWRAFSDGAWSDFDGRGDTDGIGAIDNVLVTWAQSGAQTVSDNFETGDFTGISGTVGASWAPGGLQGNTYDGWHLEFDPMYKNKGNTCTFSDDWMWAAKPATSAIPENGFSYYLVTPKFLSTGWTGGIAEYSGYLCMPDANDDYTNTLIRQYNTNLGGWSLWSDFDGFITFGGCEFWNFNDFEDLTPYVGSTIDSLQIAFEVLDISQDGTFSWGKHGSSQYLIDNFSIGNFNGEATVFTARVIDIFADTYSLSDPSHTPFLQNPEQGDWIGLGGVNNRAFANSDSLTVQVTDGNGITDGNVVLWWRDDNSTGPVDSVQTYGAWSSKVMDLSVRDVQSTSDEGTYRMIIGNDAGGIEDMTAAGDQRIWIAGTTVQYYVRVQDNLGNIAYWPAGADPVNNPNETYFEFSVLPFGLSTPSEGHTILVVDDFTRNMLDFERSTGYEPTGGAGFGNFTDPVFDQPEDMIERALAILFLPDGVDGELNPAWDKYDVQGGGTSVQCEPRGQALVGEGLGGYYDDFQNPNYDVLIWSQGSFGDYSYADTTRLELGIYLDQGGNLLSGGDEVAFHLGTGGDNADSTIGFLGDYLGVSFPSATDTETTDRVLSVTGVTGSSMDGITLGIYGECPIRRGFDRLTLATPASLSENFVLMNYADGGAGDNGRAAIIKNVRFEDALHNIQAGVAVHSGFDISAFLSDFWRACYMGNVFEGDFGLNIVKDHSCSNPNVGAPVVANAFGFGLSAAAPNPFKDNTRIEFSVPSRTHVSIEVYNILGQKVRTLVDENLEADSYVRQWDGRSDAGQQVSSGIYFYKMVAGDFSDTKKTVLLKQ